MRKTERERALKLWALLKQKYPEICLSECSARYAQVWTTPPYKPGTRKIAEAETELGAVLMAARREGISLRKKASRRR